MALVKITDHTRRAILHLPPPYWGKPRLASALRAITDEVQELEDASWTVILLRMLDVATGVQLYTLGRLVGEPDLGYSEAVYRIQVKARIRINRGHGTIDDILAIMGYAFGLVEWFSTPLLPAHLELTLDTPTSSPHIGLALTRRMVLASRAAGVSVTYYVNVYAVSPTYGLRFADGSGLVPIDHFGIYSDGSGAVDVGATYLFTVETTGAPLGVGTGVVPVTTFMFGIGPGWGSPWTP